MLPEGAPWHGSTSCGGSLECQRRSALEDAMVPLKKFWRGPGNFLAGQHHEWLVKQKSDQAAIALFSPAEIA
jgi:hypothetical protein